MADQAVKFTEKRWWYAYIFVEKTTGQIIGEIRWLSNLSPAMLHNGMYVPCDTNGIPVDHRTHLR